MATNLLIVSHGTRIRCILSDLYQMEISARFKNTAILLMKIRIKTDNNTNEPIVSLKSSLFHEGEIGEKSTTYGKKSMYYTNDPNNATDLYFRPMTTTLPYESHIRGNYNIYIVRHAEGYHNLSTTIQKIFRPTDYIDPILTEKGVQQSSRAGIHLKPIQFQHLFVSDLFRTKHTLISMMLGIPEKPIVLPCANEPNMYWNKGFGKTKNRCDSFLINKTLWIPENESRCGKIMLQSCKSNDAKCRTKQKECEEDGDWMFYKMMSGQRTCHKMNMITYAIMYTELGKKKQK